MESSSVGSRAMVGQVLGLLGVVCAVLGIFFFEGISIEYVGIILGGLGYYFGCGTTTPLRTASSTMPSGSRVSSVPTWTTAALE